MLTLLTLLCVPSVDAGSRCCDGTSSSSIGPGTCSWQGGVCGTTYTPSRKPTYSAANQEVYKTSTSYSTSATTSGKWSAPARLLQPANSDETPEAVYWTAKSYFKNGTLQSLAYKCSTTNQQITLSVSDKGSAISTSWVPTHWIFTRPDNSVSEYRVSTQVQRKNNTMFFTTISKQIQEELVLASSVSIAWQEDRTNYQATWNTEGSKAAIAATAAKCDTNWL